MAVLTEIILQERASNGNYLLLIAPFILSGGAFVILNVQGPGIIVGPLLLIVGAIFSFRLFRYYYQRKNYKELMKRSLEETIERLNSTDKLIRISFHDDHFFFGDEGKMEWEQMHSFLKIEHNLFIIFDIDPFSAFALNPIDLPNSDFLEIFEFIETKLTPHSLSHQLTKEEDSNPELLDD